MFGPEWVNVRPMSTMFEADSTVNCRYPLGLDQLGPNSSNSGSFGRLRLNVARGRQEVGRCLPKGGRNHDIKCSGPHEAAER